MNQFEILEEGLDPQTIDPNTLSFEDTVNNPLHQAEADVRAAQAELHKASQEKAESDRNKARARKEAEKKENRRKEKTARTEKDAVKTSINTFVTAVIAFLIHRGGIDWLAIAVACIAAILFGIACFQWGKYWEITHVQFR